MLDSLQFKKKNVTRIFTPIKALITTFELVKFKFFFSFSLIFYNRFFCAFIIGLILELENFH
jgi:hypothetical protein